MRFITVALSTLFLCVSFTFSVSAEESIDNREAWLTDAVAMIESGDLAKLESSIKTTLGAGMEDDVGELMKPLMTLMGEHKAIYVDKLSNDKLGQSFDQHVYAAYYGEREFIFYSFTFARLENGWQLYSLDFADNLAGLDPVSN